MHLDIFSWAFERQIRAFSNFSCNTLCWYRTVEKGSIDLRSALGWRPEYIFKTSLEGRLLVLHTRGEWGQTILDHSGSHILDRLWTHSGLAKADASESQRELNIQFGLINGDSQGTIGSFRPKIIFRDPDSSL